MPWDEKRWFSNTKGEKDLPQEKPKGKLGGGYDTVLKIGSLFISGRD